MRKQCSILRTLTYLFKVDTSGFLSLAIPQDGIHELHRLRVMGSWTRFPPEPGRNAADFQDGPFRIPSWMTMVGCGDVGVQMRECELECAKIGDWSKLVNSTAQSVHHFLDGKVKVYNL